MNKKNALILFFILSIITFQAYSATKKFFRGEEMNLSEVKKQYGDSKFDVTKFRTGTTAERGKMAYSLITSKYYIGKSVSDVRTDLGSPNGYYFSDSYPAYHIDENWKIGKDTWQILFLIDRKDNIKEVVVHKNCCSKK